jgi:hypothetical protein
MSKIRLHGSSSGYTEIAPVAASGNNTLTLPNDGTIISKDSNGAVGVTSVHASSNVTVADTITLENGSAKVGSGVTLSTTGDVFFTGVSTGNGSGLTGINTPSFSAYITGNPSIAANTNTIIVFNAEDHDTDGAYDTSTGIFTVPAGKAGKYHIDAYGGVDDIDDGGYVRVFVLKNDSTMPGFRGQSHASAAGRVQTTGVSGTVTLAVGDEIKVQLFTNTAGTHEIENQASVFSMFRLAI